MPKPKKNILSALSDSIEAEAEVVKTKFDRADAYFNDSQPTNQTTQKDFPKHSKVIRDSFTFPEIDHNLIADLRSRCLKIATVANKSEILRAGLTLLSQLSDRELVAAIEQLPKIKTGRPKQKKSK
ncbi:MAG: hypothetical protein ACFBSE_02290 [Prochloraceae cyanobacterium]